MSACRWRASATTDAGDDLVLEYVDQHIPATYWQPPEYYIDYISLYINGKEVDTDIETALEKFLTDVEISTMMENAKVDNEDY